MTAARAPIYLIEGRVVHKASNALQITFSTRPDDPLAVGTQSADDGMRAKVAMLFGLRNGGPGRHVLRYTDGATLGVHSRVRQPTVLTRGPAELASIERGATSTARVVGGAAVLTFAAGPEPVTPDVFRLVVTDPRQVPVARLDVIRRVAGWSEMKALNAAEEAYRWWDHTGQALPTPLLGTRLALLRPVDDIERDVLLGACVDIALGLRPYVRAMD